MRWCETIVHFDIQLSGNNTHLLNACHETFENTIFLEINIVHVMFSEGKPWLNIT